MGALIKRCTSGGVCVGGRLFESNGAPGSKACPVVCVCVCAAGRALGHSDATPGHHGQAGLYARGTTPHHRDAWWKKKKKKRGTAPHHTAPRVLNLDKKTSAWP